METKQWVCPAQCVIVRLYVLVYSRIYSLAEIMKEYTLLSDMRKELFLKNIYRWSVYNLTKI